MHIVETADFECLYDEGVAYADALRATGIPVELNKTQGTMQGFDIVPKSTNYPRGNRKQNPIYAKNV